jgi:hypothetical protein
VMLLAVTTFAGCTLQDEDGVREDGTIAAPDDVAAPPPDALKTPSGLASKEWGCRIRRPGPP